MLSEIKTQENLNTEAKIPAPPSSPELGTQGNVTGQHEESRVELTGADVEPDISSEISEFVANTHESQAQREAQAAVNAALEADLKRGDIFPRPLSTGGLARGEGQALNQVEGERISFLERARNKLFAGKKAA